MSEVKLTTTHKEGDPMQTIVIPPSDEPMVIWDRGHLPTCSELERKFLDALKGKFRHIPFSETNDEFLIADSSSSEIYQNDFPGIDLKELLG